MLVDIRLGRNQAGEGQGKSEHVKKVVHPNWVGYVPPIIVRQQLCAWLLSRVRQTSLRITSSLYGLRSNQSTFNVMWQHHKVKAGMISTDDYSVQYATQSLFPTMPIRNSPVRLLFAGVGKDCAGDSNARRFAQ